MKTIGRRDGGEAPTLAAQVARSVMKVISQIEHANVVNLGLGSRAHGRRQVEEDATEDEYSEDWVYEAEMRTR